MSGQLGFAMGGLFELITGAPFFAVLQQAPHIPQASAGKNLSDGKINSDFIISHKHLILLSFSGAAGQD
jgi:hypothetical protein